MKSCLTFLPRRYAVALGLLLAWTALGWDYQGHRLISQLALSSLPPDFPQFVRSARAKERIAFLGGEPDRWRNTGHPILKHCNNPDHYLDIEDLAPYGMSPARLNPFRYEFVGEMAAAKLARPGDFPALDPEKDPARILHLPGFLPWAITEDYEKLRSAFSYLKVFEEAGTKEEIANARENVIYLMGTMAHFIGDASQPLHTTRHFNGWVGDNPKGYSTKRTFHAWIDGGFLEQVELDTPTLFKAMVPATIPWPSSARPPTNVFARVMEYVVEQHQHVEPLYLLEQNGRFDARSPHASEGRDFLGKQLVRAGQFLGQIWFAAWKESVPDTYLKSALARRKLKKAEPPKP